MWQWSAAPRPTDARDYIKTVTAAWLGPGSSSAHAVLKSLRVVAQRTPSSAAACNIEPLRVAKWPAIATREHRQSVTTNIHGPLARLFERVLLRPPRPTRWRRRASAEACARESRPWSLRSVQGRLSYDGSPSATQGIEIARDWWLVADLLRTPSSQPGARRHSLALKPHKLKQWG